MYAPAGTESQVLADLAATNPITYFNLVELVCRRELFDWEKIHVPAMMLSLPSLFMGENRDRLITTWPSTKAYASAYASWIKACVKVLAEAHRSLAAAGRAMDPELLAEVKAAAGARAEAAEEAKAAAERPPAVGSVLSAKLWSAAVGAAEVAAAAVSPAAFEALQKAFYMVEYLTVQLRWLGGELCSGLRAPAERHEAAHLQLILMLLLARGVLGAGRHLVGVLPHSSRSSRGRKQDQEGSCIADLEASSSSIRGAVSGGGGQQQRQEE